MKKILFLLVLIYNYGFSYTTSEMLTYLSNYQCTTTATSSTSNNSPKCSGSSSYGDFGGAGETGAIYHSRFSTDHWYKADGTPVEFCVETSTRVGFSNCTPIDAPKNPCDGNSTKVISGVLFSCASGGFAPISIPDNGFIGPDGNLGCNSGYSITGVGLGIPACMSNPDNGTWDDNDDLVCDLHYHKDETGNSCVIDAGWNDLTGNLDDPTGTGGTGTGGTGGTGTGDTGTGTGDTGTGGTGTGTGDTGTGGTGTGTGDTGTGDTGTGGTGTGDTGTGTGTGGTGTGTGGTGTGTGGTGTGTGDTGTGGTGTDLSGVLSALEKLNNDNNSNLSSTNLKLNQTNINLNSIDSNINKINDYNKTIDDSISSVSVPTVESFTSLDGLSISDSFSSTLGNVSSKYLNIFSGVGNSSVVPQNIVFSVFGLDFTLIEFSVFNDYVDYIRGLFLFLAYFSSFLYFIRGAR